MDLKEYRENPREQARINSLLNLIPTGETALDIGTRDGYFAQKLAGIYSTITALDLEAPEISHPRIKPVKGNVGALQFSDSSFDTVLCAEVLEHLPGDLLKKACNELTRVVRHNLVVGVPYKQDIRVGRTTCYTCGKSNPPWGHVNVFDEKKLEELFPGMQRVKVDFVGSKKEGTNWLSTLLLDYAGNPYGTYSQDEVCINCNSKLVPPPARNLAQKICTKAAHLLNNGQKRLIKTNPNWIHVLFTKNSAMS